MKRRKHPLDLLPPELWAIICGLLPLDSLWSLRCTSKFFLEFVRPHLLHAFFQTHPVLAELFRVTHEQLLETTSSLGSPVPPKSPVTTGGLSPSIRDLTPISTSWEGFRYLSTSNPHNSQINHSHKHGSSSTSAAGAAAGGAGHSVSFNTGLLSTSWQQSEIHIPHECPDPTQERICHLASTHRLIHLMHHNIPRMVDLQLQQQGTFQNLIANRHPGDDTSDDDSSSDTDSESDDDVSSDGEETLTTDSEEDFDELLIIAGGQEIDVIPESSTRRLGRRRQQQNLPLTTQRLAGRAHGRGHHRRRTSNRSLAYPPRKYTDRYEEWAQYDPSLQGLDREMNMQQFRQEQGRRGSGVLSVQYVRWQVQRDEMIRQLSIMVARMWCVLGQRRFPFSHKENKEWKRRRRERGIQDEPAKKSQNGSRSSRRGNGKESRRRSKSAESSRYNTSQDIRNSRSKSSAHIE